MRGISGGLDGGSCGGQAHDRRRPRSQQKVVHGRVVYRSLDDWPPRAISLLRSMWSGAVPESRILAWVGATCAGCAPPVSCLGEFHLSAQRLHLSAQRQSAGLPRSARESGLKGAAVVGASQRSGRCSVRRSAELGPTLTILSGLRVFATWPRKRWRFRARPKRPKTGRCFRHPKQRAQNSNR